MKYQNRHLTINKTMWFCDLIIVFILAGCQMHGENQGRQSGSLENKATIIRDKSETNCVFIDGCDTLIVKAKNLNDSMMLYLVGNDSIIVNSKDTIVNDYKMNIEDYFGHKIYLRSPKVADLIFNFTHKDYFINPVKVDNKWLDFMEKNNGNSVSADHIPDVFNPNKSTFGCEFSMITANLDDDPGPEKILQFTSDFNSVIVVLVKTKRNWFCKSRTIIPNHVDTPKISIIKENYTFIKCLYESSWGTGYYNNNISLLRFIDGRINTFLDCVSLQGQYYHEAVSWMDLKSEFVFINADTIRIDYSFDLYSLKGVRKDLKPDTYILKDKKESVFYKLNVSKKQYEIYKTTNKFLMQKKWLDNIDLHDYSGMYKREMDSIRKFGSKQQKQFFINKGIDGY